MKPIYKLVILIALSVILSQVVLAVSLVPVGSIGNISSGNYSLDNALDVFVSGDYAYTTSYVDDTLAVFDISAHGNPVPVGSITDNAGNYSLDAAYGVFVSGDYAYTTSNLDDTLAVFNIIPNTAPTVTISEINSTLGTNTSSENITLWFTQSDVDPDSVSNTTWFDSISKKSVLVMDFSINSTSQPNLVNGAYSSCYQEYANQSTECGGLNTGTYSDAGNWSWMDGNWDNYVNKISDGVTTAYINYSIPTGALNSSKWVVKASSTKNITLPSGCFGGDTLNLRVTLAYAEMFISEVALYCLSSGEWVATNPAYIDFGAILYEEAMMWDYGAANVSSALWTSAGRVDGGYVFDGIDDYVSMPDSSEYDGGQSISISAWVKRRGATASGYPGIIAKDQGDADANWRSWNVYGDTAYTSWYATVYNTSNASITVTCQNTLASNNWLHVAVTYNGTTLTAYHNGTFCAYKNFTGMLRETPAMVTVGKYYYDTESAYTFNGTIDEVRVYNWSLSSGQIANEFNLDYHVLHSQETTKGDVWTANIIASDGELYSTVQTSSITILNSLPTTPTTLSPSNNTRNTDGSITITCSGATDADGDALTYYIYNMSGPYSDCYQEYANQSTSCGGLSTGSYSSSGGPWAPTVDNAINGVWGEGWDTGSSIRDLVVGYIYINYSKPMGAVSALWQTKEADTDYEHFSAQNLTITSQCFSQPNIQLKIISNGTGGAVGYHIDSLCYDGSSWVLLRHNAGNGFNTLIEEAMIWDYGENLIQSNTSTTYEYATTDGTRYWWFCQANDSVSFSANTSLYTFYENGMPANVDITAPVNNTYKNVNSMFINITAGTDAEGDPLYYAIYSDTSNPPTTLRQTTSLCYQEYANVSTACGGLATGTYSDEGNWSWTDGNWDTYLDRYTAGDTRVYINYTKLTNALNTSRWMVKGGGTTNNYTIPQNCFDQEKIQLMGVLLYAPVTYSGLDLYCWSGSGWDVMYYVEGGAIIYEEAMIWNISQTYYNYTDMADGRYFIKTVVGDGYEDNSTAEIKTYIIDTTLPMFLYNATVYGNNSYIIATNFVIAGTLTETNFANITYYLYNSSFIEINQTISSTATDLSFNFSTLANGRYFYKVSVTDIAGNTNATRNNTFVLDTANPTVHLISPINATSNTTSTYTFSCNATDLIGVANITLYHNISGAYIANYTESALSTNNRSMILAYAVYNISAGNYTWGCRACDTASNCAYSAYNFSLGVIASNTAPIINTSSLEPDPAYAASTLNCTVIVEDIDAEDTLYVNYTWYRDGTINISGQQSATNGTAVSIYLTSGVTKGEVWNCSVMAYDEALYSEIKSINISISNTAPTVTLVNTTADDLKNDTNSNLTCTYIYSDIDADSEAAVEIRWFNISGTDHLEQEEDKNATTLNQLNTTHYEQWYCSVRVEDGEDWSGWYNSSILTIIDLAPVWTSIPGNSTNEDTAPDSNWFNLSVYASDADNDDMTFTVESQTNASLIDCMIIDTRYINCSIPASNQTGDNILTVKAEDETYSATTTINVSVLAVNDAPVVISSIPVEGDRVSKNGSSGYPLDFIFYTYDIDSATVSCEVWMNDTGAFLSRGLNASIVTSGASSITGNITMNTSLPDGTYTYYINCNDGTLSTNSTQKTFSIDTDIPDWTLREYPSYDNSTLVSWYLPLDPSVYDDDLEDIVLNITNISMESYYSNVTIGYTETELTYEEVVNVSAWPRGTYIIILNATDGGVNARIESYEITVDRLPIVATPDITIDDPTNRTPGNLTCSWTTSDFDSDAIVANETRWYRNSIEITKLRNVTWVSSGNTSRDNAWYCSVRANDGLGWSNWTDSGKLTILNAYPTATANISSTDGANTTQSDLATGWTFSDIDSNDTEISHEIRWFRNIIEVVALKNSTTATSDNTAKHEIWVASVRVSDGTDWSEWSNSSNLTILNTAPARPALVNPANGVSTGDATPFFDWGTATDPDGDVVNYTLIIANDSLITDIVRNFTGTTTSYYTSTLLYDNLYFWRVVAFDNESMFGTVSEVWQITVSTSSPSITDIVETPGIIYNNDTVWLNATVTDNNVLSTVWIGGNWSGDWVNYTVSLNSGDTYSFQLEAGNLSNGKYISWRYYANNTGLKETASDIQTFSVSNRDPYIESNATIPADVYHLNVTYVYFNISDPDGDTISWANYSLWAPNGTAVYTNKALNNITGLWNTSIFTLDDGGRWVWNVTISDGHTTSNFTGFVFLNDSTVPVLILYSPSGDTSSTTTTLQFYVSDNIRLSSCWYFDSGASGSNISIDCSDNDTSFDALVYGTHRFKFYVNDTSGNVNYTSLNYTISTSSSAGGGSSGSSGDRVEYVYVEQPGETGCGNLVCDWEDGEDIFSCPGDCPFDIQDIGKNLGSLFGQSWFVKSGLLFLIMVFLLIAYDQLNKQAKKTKFQLPVGAKGSKWLAKNRKIKIPKWYIKRWKKNKSKGGKKK